MRDFRAEIKRFTRDNKRIASQPSSIPFERIEFDMEKKKEKSRRDSFSFLKPLIFDWLIYRKI